MPDLSERLPTVEEAAVAEEVLTALAHARGDDGAVTILQGRGVELTPALAEAMVELLSIVARGEMVTLVPTGALLSTHKAADILNVSRPHLSKLLKEGVIPFTKVGSHRRVRFEDLMAFKEKRDSRREQGLRELQRLGQEMDAT